MYDTKTCLHLMYFFMWVQNNHSHPCLHDNDAKSPNSLPEYVENLTATKTAINKVNPNKSRRSSDNNLTSH